jgi:hypothetical protein
MPLIIKKISPKIIKFNKILRELNEEDKSLLFFLFPLLKEDDIERLTQNRSLLRIVIENIKEKRRAFENLDEKKLDQILKQEREFLENI